jgi:hypothetical protein
MATTSKSSEIFSSALSLDLDKKIVLTFTDRKKFLSMKTGLYTAKKALGNTTIKIKTSNDNTITLQRYEEDEGFYLEIEDSNKKEFSIFQEDKAPAKKEAIQKILSLTKEKDSLLEELQTWVSLLGKEQTLQDQTDPESKLFKMTTKFNKIQREISELYLKNKIPPPRTPTDEPPNEESLIEP